MILTVQIEVDEEEYKEAIVKGWWDRFQETITVDDVGTLDNFGDFRYALYFLDVKDDAGQVTVKR